MSTFLELVQEVARKSGASGSVPSSVVSQSGRNLKIVNFTADAYVTIQQYHRNWKWMRKRYTGTLVPGRANYPGAYFSKYVNGAAAGTIDDFGRFAEDGVKRKYYPHTLYDSTIGVSDERLVRQIPYDLWVTRYFRGQQDTSKPTEYAISDEGEICYGRKPDAAYVVNGEYWQSAIRLVNNTDTPSMPSDHHTIIVDQALVFLHDHDEAWGKKAEAEADVKRRLFYLENDQLPAIIMAGPLA